MADIRHLLRIEAPPEQVCQAITTAAGIRSWWTTDADLDGQVGGLGVFRFHYNHVVETKVRITELQPYVSWLVLDSFRPEQNGTSITFELRPDGQVTLLHFSQNGYAAADDSFALMNTGWAYYLVSLKQYLEKGKGQPSPHVDFDIILKNGIPLQF